MKPLHASTEQLRGFWRHELTPDELVTIGDHLAACSECRELAADLASNRGMERHVMEALAGQDHLSFEELEKLAANAEMPEHVLGCAVCAAELNDLRKFL